MPELTTTLASRGFESVDAGLPGGWSTDGEWTVVVESRMSGVGFEHTATVYDVGADELTLQTEPVATATSSGHGGAIRAALDDAGYDGGADDV